MGMEAWAWVLIAVVALVVVAIVVWLLVRRSRSRELQREFGSEYDRTMARSDRRSLAESDLRERRDRVERLNIRPLSQSDHDRFASEWTKVQAEFVDEPSEAVSDADGLIQQVMTTRGYPVEDFDQRAADISVDHPDVVENYRSAHSIAVKERQGESDTESLRKAMTYYRSLFDELLVIDDGRDRRN
jgi:hypothetical protein